MKTKYSITGLDCPNCAAKLASLIEKDSQIQSCRINFLAEKITVESELDEQRRNDASVVEQRHERIGADQKTDPHREHQKHQKNSARASRHSRHTVRQGIADEKACRGCNERKAQRHDKGVRIGRQGKDVFQRKAAVPIGKGKVRNKHQRSNDKDHSPQQIRRRRHALK